jgi:dihydrofolate reductase
MQTISLIAAIDEKNGLGHNQQLLCYLPADLKYFKEITLNKTIIMGRKTFDSIGRVLPNRRNIIISRQNLLIDGAIVVHSIAEALQQSNDADEVIIIGGAELFSATMSIASYLYITRIHAVFPADVFFPMIDLSVWQCFESSYRPKDDKNEYDLTFEKYIRKKT